jgi:large subunit ribosomal protein L9
MKVILLADVYKHGVAGEVISVSDGFARNWLLPKNLAKKATPGALRQAEVLRAQAATRRSALDQRLNELARQIDGVELFFGRRASPTGKLFGSVTTSEIAHALFEKTGIDINRRRISQTALREIGTHEVPVRLGSESSPTLRVTIVREEEFANFMATQGQAAPEAEAEAAAEPNLLEKAGEVVAEAAHAVGDAVQSVVETVREAVSGGSTSSSDESAAE